ncbi:Integrase catalytic region [Candidatus Desulfosporosinus infrequens]|uniref:Integrase catalytic region n=1 Tax=Candidatus Desulfosporosinus infrequens TaxID=2043169 RepID=A0A2U3KW70_9FIRM|nr:Integrase catalytic region [Candidatus Desulfosporosinus infrequens]
MSQTQLNRFTVISKVIDGHMTIAEAAVSLGISQRQIIRLKQGVIAQGASFLIHKNTGRKPSHTLDDKLVAEIIALKESNTYQSANFLHFQELLERQENIKISYSALHSLLSKSNIKSPKKRRRFKPHRRRKRKPQEGLLIQMDATPFEWFDSSEKFSLHGAIDDATGNVVGLYMTKNECLHGYWEVMRQCLINHGIPVSLYTDRHAIFLSTLAGKLSIEDQLSGKVVNDTQFGRAMGELGITLIPARSPQAKGRVERLWATLQSRLPVEFKIAGISTVDQANEFLATYISLFNHTFAVEPEDTQSAYRSVSPNMDIDSILCVKLTRSVDAGGVFSFYNRNFKVITSSDLPAIANKAKVSVLVGPRIGVAVQYKKVLFQVVPYIKQRKPDKTASAPKHSNIPYSPPDSHYFKYGHTLVKKITFEDKDKDILLMLESIFLKKYA